MTLLMMCHLDARLKIFS